MATPVTVPSGKNVLAAPEASRPGLSERHRRSRRAGDAASPEPIPSRIRPGAVTATVLAGSMRAISKRAEAGDHHEHTDRHPSAQRGRRTYVINC